MHFFETIKYQFGEYVKIDPESGTITFKIQDGPIKEFGINGCQIDEIGKVWLTIIKYFNKKFPCYENMMSMRKIEEALMWQGKRTENRTKRGVEGYSKV